MKSGKTVTWEFMRIASNADGQLSFFPQPSAQPPGAFAMVRQSPDEVVFESATHDFPQRVIYRIGPPDKLRASIEGMRNGNLRSIPFPMTRVSCEVPR